MTDQEYDIHALLREDAAAKERRKVIRGRMVKFAVEEIGISQAEALSMDIAAFLDGYLVARGFIQPWRIKEAA